MKRFIIIAILLLPALAACTDNSGSGIGSATSVTLSRDKVDLLVGETVTLSATVLPESLGMGVEWSVVDEEFADVKDGVVTAKAEGVTYVVATSADGKQKAACMVSVNPEVQYAVYIKDASGQLLTGLYGWPGMTETLSAVTSDGGIHIFTWSVDDSAAATVTSAGAVTLGKVASTSAEYVYDAESFIKVVTEDGCGCKIPVRSSILAGLKVGEAFNPSGTPVIVQASGSYPVEVMYQGEMGPVAIPSEQVDIELGNTTDFSVGESGGVITLTTGPSTGVSSSVSVSIGGSAEKIAVAQLKIDKVYAIKALFAGSSSSTLTFTWTEGGSESDDVAKPYTIFLYKDEACTDLEVSFSIPASDGCWNARQPKFVFSGLEPGTDYWFRVEETGSADKESPVIPATTDAFDIVMVSSDPAAVGDVILAEDFGQLCWGADEITEAAGYDVASSSVAYNTDTKESFTSRNAEVFVGTTGQYAQRSITAQSVAKKESGFRLAKWAQGQYARIYIGPGYLFLSTKSYGTHILTPQLNSIPEGKTAKLMVTVHAAGKSSGGEAVFAVQHGTTFYEMSSGTQTNKAKDGRPVDLSTNIETVTFNGGLTSLEKFEVTLDGVVTGDRIAFGPTSETAADNSNMMIISDMTIKILELN